MIEIKQAEDWLLEELKDTFSHHTRRRKIIETCLIALKEMKPEEKEK